MLLDIKMYIDFFLGCVDMEIFYIEFFGVNVLYLDVDFWKMGIIVFVGDINVWICFYWYFKFMFMFVLFFFSDCGWVDVEVIV